MGHIIAMAGKGGTGKTTVAALIVRIIKEKKLGSILAVDADPNSNLGEVLGLEAKETVGDILDDISAHPEKVPSGMSKDRFIEYKVHTSISESDGFDVLTMGRPEGPGCYCYVNNALRNVVSKLIEDYDYVVIDNEAGLEHLSRRTTRKANVLVVISDATVVGLKAAKRISELAVELRIDMKKKLLLIDRYGKEIEKEKIKDSGLNCIGYIPEDKQITALSINGGSVMRLAIDSVSMAALQKIGEQIWLRN